MSGTAGQNVAADGPREPQAGRVRRFRPQDVDAVMAIASESPEAASWSKKSYLRLVQETGALSLVIEIEGQIAGFLVGRLAADQAEVFNLAVKHTHRRKGLGAGLLAAALRKFASHGALRAYLEVRESNRGAIAFYEKYAFVKTGRRNGYYRNPDEAAIVMQKKLTG